MRYLYDTFIEKLAREMAAHFPKDEPEVSQALLEDNYPLNQEAHRYFLENGFPTSARRNDVTWAITSVKSKISFEEWAITAAENINEKKYYTQNDIEFVMSSQVPGVYLETDSLYHFEYDFDTDCTPDEWAKMYPNNQFTYEMVVKRFTAIFADFYASNKFVDYLLEANYAFREEKEQYLNDHSLMNRIDPKIIKWDIQIKPLHDFSSISEKFCEQHIIENNKSDLSTAIVGGLRRFHGAFVFSCYQEAYDSGFFSTEVSIKDLNELLHEQGR